MSELPRVEAIDRALLVLGELAAAGPDGAPLADLAERTGLNKSTVYRALSTMRLRDFATQSVTNGYYQLGTHALSLGERFLTPQHLSHLLHPTLLALTQETNELVHLGVWADDHVRYIDKVEPARPIRVWSAIGQRVPVATSSLGRALLAASPAVHDEQLAVYLRTPPANQVSLSHLRAAVKTAQRRGYATELEENEPGVACLGFALLRNGQPIAAVSITSLAERMTSRRQAELAEICRRCVPSLLPTGFTMAPSEASPASPSSGGVT